MNYLKKILAVIALWMVLAISAQAGKVTYVYTDPQGTPLAEADTNGNVTGKYDYKPYGSQALGSAPSGPGYTGHVNDPDIGFVYMQARYYDPEIGRFLSIDPVTPAAGEWSNFSRYIYTNNNPIVRIDPDGRWSEDSFWVGAAKGIADTAVVTWQTAAVAQFSPIMASVPIMPFRGANGPVGQGGYKFGSVLAMGALVLAGPRGSPAVAGVSAAERVVVSTTEAVGARDALAASLAPLKGRGPATVTAGVNVETGQVAARACGGGQCAEDHVVTALGGDASTVRFTTAVRPRSGEQVSICERCEQKYGRDAFPDDARFKSDEKK